VRPAAGTLAVRAAVVHHRRLVAVHQGQQREGHPVFLQLGLAADDLQRRRQPLLQHQLHLQIARRL
jgi:hypothetical protein